MAEKLRGPDAEKLLSAVVVLGICSHSYLTVPSVELMCLVDTTRGAAAAAASLQRVGLEPIRGCLWSDTCIYLALWDCGLAVVVLLLNVQRPLVFCCHDSCTCYVLAVLRL